MKEVFGYLVEWNLENETIHCPARHISEAQQIISNWASTGAFGAKDARRPAESAKIFELVKGKEISPEKD